MTISQSLAPHPGDFVRQQALFPRKLSVTAAAKLVGVGRPAFSNFLNGNASLTPAMAARIEMAFGLSAKTLMEMQATHDNAIAASTVTTEMVGRYVPPFLQFRANDIEHWLNRNVVGRSRLAVFLRTLANSTGRDISKIDFPGNDDAERPGWDGFIQAAHGTQWIPQGASGWEFGTNARVKTKADGDFAKSVKATDAAERADITFVFVTPRPWTGKKEWVRENAKKGLWKDVRAYDASDLEQWLEQSIAGQTWFANETGRAADGVRTLDRCWSDWVNVTAPQLTSKLFADAVQANKRPALDRISDKTGRPIAITADSIGEALAFLARLFSSDSGEPAFESLKERVLVFDTPGTLSRLAQGAKDFIAVTANRDVEREIATVTELMHSFVIYPRNTTSVDPDIVLEPSSEQSLRAALGEMNLEPDDIRRLVNESGRSLTVLRRRMATTSAIRTPTWASDARTAASLASVMFLGAWNSENPIDQTALVLLANAPSYDAIEQQIRSFARLDDAPVWSIGNMRGVVSKIDLLFATADQVTAEQLSRFYAFAALVLGEDDPQLDLPPEKRWMLHLREHTREFSSTLRSGISETLVLLSVYGNSLFRAALGFDCEAQGRLLVKQILTPLTVRKLEANDRELTAYAEVDPETFLEILEADLREPKPETIRLMRPANTEMFGGGCPRSGLLWALESLAWKPSNLPRVSLILAQLACVEIEDNWSNKPIRSLEGIFRSWMPQTAAGHDERVQAIKLVETRYPDIAWKICLSQIASDSQYAAYNSKPRWRNDGYGFGEPVNTWAPITAFAEEMVAMVTEWKRGYTADMLGELVDRLNKMHVDWQHKVLGLVRSWAQRNATESEKAHVRERIRVALSLKARGQRVGGKPLSSILDEFSGLFEELEPKDVLQRHAWLFKEHWVSESFDELQEAQIDYSQREKRIAERRVDALKQVLANDSYPAIIDLAKMGKTAGQIGWLLSRHVLRNDQICELVSYALDSTSSEERPTRDLLIRGLLAGVADESERFQIQRDLMSGLAKDAVVRALLLAPFRLSTWKMVDELDLNEQASYWKTVVPDWIRDAEHENDEAVRRLLAFDRPYAAFACVQYSFSSLSADMLYQLLSDLPLKGKDQADGYRLDQHHLQEAFVQLGTAAKVGVEAMAALELTFIDGLTERWVDGGKWLIANLEKYVELHPEIFVEAVTWAYKPSGYVEPSEADQTSSEERSIRASRGYKLLNSIRRIPGTLAGGTIDEVKLSSWVDEVRNACSAIRRLRSADHCIGQLLSHAPYGADGVWPCEPVRDLIEHVHSDDLVNGVYMELYNSRGVFSRGEGGAQERGIAEKYRRFANAVQYTHPFLASSLFMGLVRTYEGEAARADMEAILQTRMN